MDIIEMTRELGKALQQDDRYIAYTLAKQVNDDDAELQEDIAKFSALQEEIGKNVSTDNPDADKLKELDTEIKALYKKIMSNKNMIVFNAAQKSLESLVNNITQIISLCANGGDPDTCQPVSGCSGSCSGCNGCG